MDILIIIAKSAAILTLFYVLYQAILQKDTFYTANRHYLLAGIIAALSIPFIEFTKTVYIDLPVSATGALDTNNFAPILLETAPEEHALEINWWMVALVIYGLGVGIMIGRLLVQLYSLYSLLRKYPSSTVGDFTYVQIIDNIAPFSFFRYICYNPALHTQEELHMIIAHEKVHAGQLHTIDVLLTRVVLALQWINPLAWFYKKSLEQNLEFLADSGALRAVNSSKEYQYTLVKVSSTALRPALTNQFYHSLIKKRIVMLNKETSSRRNLWKLGLVLPLLGLFMYSFNTKEIIEYREVARVAKTAFANLPSGQAGAISETSFQEFQVDKTTSKAYLTSIENYFKNTFKSTQVRFSNVKFKEGQLVRLDFLTKMKDDARFYTRFSMKAGNKGVSSFTLTPIKEHEILQTYQDGHQVQFTPEGSNTTITMRDNGAYMGEDPILVVNGSVIQTNANKITYETDAGIKIVKPKEAVALYGKAARDGAIVIDDPMYTTKINGKFIKHPAFVINHTTADTQIEALENYFTENHPDALIDIHDIKRDNKGEIESYNIRTKFESTPEWQNILDVRNKKLVKQGIQVRYLEGNVIQLKELGSKGIEMRSTPEGLFIDDDTLGIGLTAYALGTQALSTNMKKDVLLHFTKNTTDIELSVYKSQLKQEHDLDLNYAVVRNALNEIINIQISYTGIRDQGNYSINGDKPIQDFYFSIDQDKTTGFWSAALQDATKKQDSSRQERRKIIQERRMQLSSSGEKNSQILPEPREKRDAQPEETKQKTENSPKTTQDPDYGYVTIDDTTYYFVNKEDEGTTFYNKFGEVIPENDPLHAKLFQKKNKPIKLDVLKEMALGMDKFPENALYVLDGIELTERPIALDPNSIKNVSVLKGKTATSLYGKKGKNGVVIIETKRP